MPAIRNILFAVIVGLALALPIPTSLLARAGVEFPAWTGISEGTSYLSGDVRSGFPKPDIESIANGDFQSDVESYVSERVPLYDQMVLADASASRLAISQMATLCGYDWYPTYYGSPYIYIPQNDALAPLAGSVDADELEAFEEVIGSIGEFAARYPQIRFHICLIDEMGYSRANPTAQYIVGFTPTEDIAARGLAACSGVPNVSFDCVFYDTLDAYYDNYYHTDHHWNIHGAAEAFNAFARSASLDPVDLATERLWFDDLAFNGSNARFARAKIDETVFDMAFDFSNLSFAYDGSTETMSPGEMHDAFFSTPRRDFQDFYEDYYGQVDDVVVTNPDATGCAIIYGDSYASLPLYFIAENYATTVVQHELYWENSGDDRMSSDIAQWGCTDVYFIGNTADFASLTERYPHFFEV